MQTVINVVCKKSASLRKAICNDPKGLNKYDLEVTQSKKKGRSKGWAKIKGHDMPGALNFEWVASTQTLSARICTKKNVIPSLMMGAFTAYLTERYKNKIVSTSTTVLK